MAKLQQIELINCDCLFKTQEKNSNASKARNLKVNDLCQVFDSLKHCQFCK